MGGPAAAAHPRRSRRRRVPAADLHEDGAGPADAVLRGDRAPRRPRVRRRQLQGAVRGDRARAGAPRKPLTGLAELHTHLGGSVASDILWSLAHEQGIALPVKDYWEFDRLV